MDNGCKQIAQLEKKGLECQNRVYSVDYSAPTITTCGDGNREPKTMEKQNCRVRKLTENECGKLMGVKPCDIKKIGKNLRKSAMYHCFGDSIVVPVLMALFGEMTDIDYQEKIKETVENIREQE